MTAINRLTNKATLADSDLIPIWDGDAGRTRSVNADALARYVSSEIDDGIYIKSGVYSNGVLTLTYNNGTTTEVGGLPPDGLTLVKGEEQFSGITSLEIGDNISVTQDESGNTLLSGDPTGATAQEVIEAIEQELADNTVKFNFVDTDQILLQLPAFDEVISITAFINELGQSIIVKPATSINPTTNILTVNFVSPHTGLLIVRGQ